MFWRTEVLLITLAFLLDLEEAIGLKIISGILAASQMLSQLFYPFFDLDQIDMNDEQIRSYLILLNLLSL